MNKDKLDKAPIDLGRASTKTRGGPIGVDDFEDSLMLGHSGLTQD